MTVRTSLELPPAIRAKLVGLAGESGKAMNEVMADAIDLLWTTLNAPPKLDTMHLVIKYDYKERNNG